MKKPSVTELTALLDKPALLTWANNIGLQGIRLSEYRNASTKSGSNMHKIIESYLLLGVEMPDKGMQDRCKIFFSDKEILGIETKIETEYFTGRYDVKFIHKGVMYIADFKSNQKGIYIENKLQLSAYRMADGCDKVCIVSIPDFVLIPIDDINFNDCERALILLSELFTLKNNL